MNLFSQLYHQPEPKYSVYMFFTWKEVSADIIKHKLSQFLNSDGTGYDENINNVYLLIGGHEEYKEQVNLSDFRLISNRNTKIDPTELDKVEGQLCDFGTNNIMEHPGLLLKKCIGYTKSFHDYQYIVDTYQYTLHSVNTPGVHNINFNIMHSGIYTSKTFYKLYIAMDEADKNQLLLMFYNEYIKAIKLKLAQPITGIPNNYGTDTAHTTSLDPINMCTEEHPRQRRKTGNSSSTPVHKIINDTCNFFAINSTSGFEHSLPNTSINIFKSVMEDQMKLIRPFDISSIGGKRFIAQMHHLKHHRMDYHVAIDGNSCLLKYGSDGSTATNGEGNCNIPSNVRGITNINTCYVNYIRGIHDFKIEKGRRRNPSDLVYGFSASKLEFNSLSSSTDFHISITTSLYKYLIISPSILSNIYYDPYLKDYKEDGDWLTRCALGGYKNNMLKNNRFSVCKDATVGCLKQPHGTRITHILDPSVINVIPNPVPDNTIIKASSTSHNILLSWDLKWKGYFFYYIRALKNQKEVIVPLYIMDTRVNSRGLVEAYTNSTGTIDSDKLLYMIGNNSDNNSIEGRGLLFENILGSYTKSQLRGPNKLGKNLFLVSTGYVQHDTYKYPECKFSEYIQNNYNLIINFSLAFTVSNIFYEKFKLHNYKWFNPNVVINVVNDTWINNQCPPTSSVIHAIEMHETAAPHPTLVIKNCISDIVREFKSSLIKGSTGRAGDFTVLSYEYPIHEFVPLPTLTSSNSSPFQTGFGYNDKNAHLGVFNKIHFINSQ